MPHFSLLALALVFVLGACGEDSPSNSEPMACEPDLTTWETDIAPIVERHCGTCHGESPDFGAPNALVDHAMLLAGEEGARGVDRIVARLADGTMPPASMPRPPQEDMQAIVAWASCGSADAPVPNGLTSTAPVLLAPEQPPEGLETVDLLADDFEIGVDVLDHYQCWTFEAPVTEDRFIRRFEMVIDESRVLHHLVLLRDTEGTAPDGAHECNSMPDGSDYLYAWAPGQGAFEFPEGGMRIRPGDRYVMQIHYNNGAGLPDISDNSGVRLYLGPTEGTEYGMLAVGPLGFVLPPRSTTNAESLCTVTEPMQVLSGMPHMHEYGSTFDQEVRRADGTVEPFISLTGWSFESQLFYDTPATLQPGDALYTRCGFDNGTSETVRSGPRTGDEMCFNFAYVSPPPGERYCDEDASGIPDDIDYAPGECAPMDRPAETELVRGDFSVDTLPVLTGGVPADGLYALSGTTQWLGSADLPVGQLDSDTSFVLGRGWLNIAGGEVQLDISTYTYFATTSGFAMGRETGTSFGGTWEPNESPISVMANCPGDSVQEVDYGVEDDAVTVGFRLDIAGIAIYPRFTFTRIGD